MNKLLGVLCAAATLALIGPASADIIAGSPNTGNCYPWLCNDSGTDSGLTIKAQQVYSSTLFSGATTIISATAFFEADAGGSALELGGTYQITYGYAAHGSVNNLSTTLDDNWLSGQNKYAYTYFLADGSLNVNPSAFLPLNFAFDPSIGDLLIEVDAYDQPNEPNTNGRGFFLADYTGSVMSRAYCITGQNCNADATGLYTTFQTDGTVIPPTDAPEPASIALLGAGLLGLRRRKK